MATPSSAPVAAINSVVGSQFCAPNPVDLAIVRQLVAIIDCKYAVKDVNGNILFKVKGGHICMFNQRVILDATGNPIITLRPKTLTTHCRWKVFRGASSDNIDLLFSAKRSSILQWKTKLDVFLANNTTEVCDFKVKGNWLQQSCVVYAGESSTIVAQVKYSLHKQVGSVMLGKSKLMVRVNPNFDYAFIVALIVILDEINNGGR